MSIVENHHFPILTKNYANVNYDQNREYSGYEMVDITYG